MVNLHSRYKLNPTRRSSWLLDALLTTQYTCLSQEKYHYSRDLWLASLTIHKTLRPLANLSVTARAVKSTGRIQALQLSQLSLQDYSDNNLPCLWLLNTGCLHRLALPPNSQSPTLEKTTTPATEKLTQIVLIYENKTIRTTKSLLQFLIRQRTQKTKIIRDMSKLWVTSCGSNIRFGSQLSLWHKRDAEERRLDICVIWKTWNVVTKVKPPEGSTGWCSLISRQLLVIPAQPITGQDRACWPMGGRGLVTRQRIMMISARVIFCFLLQTAATGNTQAPSTNIHIFPP